MKNKEAKRYSRVSGKTVKMKEFMKFVARKEEIDFTLEEKSGHIVYVPAKDKLNDHQVPGIVTTNVISL